MWQVLGSFYGLVRTTMAENGKNRQKRSVTIAVILASLAFHGSLIFFVQIHTPVPSERAENESLELTFSCDTDAALAASAAAALCLVPGKRTEDCLEKTDSLLKDLLAECNAVEIAFVDNIEPKPLVPLVDPVEDIVAAELLEKDALEKLEKVKREVERPKANSQVVEVTEPEIKLRPDRARFLSEFDSKVEKETVARGTTDKMVRRPSPRAKTEPTVSSNDTKESPGGKQQGRLAMRGLGKATVPDRLGMSEGLKTRNQLGDLPAFGSKQQSQQGDEGAAEGNEKSTEEGTGNGEKRALPNLQPSEEVLERVAGGGSVDKLDGVEEGDTTSLNSKQWKHAVFFNRLKRQVAQNWHPGQVYARRDPKGNVYGTKDRTTVVKVFLTPEGRLAKVYVAEESGVDFLDDEAVRAFQEASPFPNPPSALVEEESKLISFVFGFHFQVGERSNWRIFRRR